MTPERWRRIDDLFHAALDRDTGERAAFLRESCRDDSDLRREVESLLSQSSSGHLLDQSLGTVAADVLAPTERFAAGSMLGPYRIEEPLGAGGMGQVYRACDTRLGRGVALKVLPADQLADPERRRRLLSEARAASALNHPHIVTFYDLLEDGGERVLVLEYVAGKTLAELIGLNNGGQGLRLSEALAYAIQIAGGLAAAHQASIVHRDIKPSNVIVTESGTVKILDFGLAKFTGAEIADGRSLDMPTAGGRIVGTVAYMSPEQAEGLRVDARSDIFSFGVVLHEMLTGRRAFRRDTATSTLAAILRDDLPPVDGAPPALQALLARCLRKDPARRAQSMADIQVALEEIRDEVERGTAPRIAGGSHRLALPVALTLLAAMTGASLWYVFGKRAEPPLRTVPLTTYAGYEQHPSFSPDGSQVAFSWNGEGKDNFDIYVKVIGSDRPLRLTTDPLADETPAWSPDGRSIAFVRRHRDGRQEILLVPALGGGERQLTMFPAGAPLALAPDWSPDGRWLVVGNDNVFAGAVPIYLVSAETGAQRQVTFPPASTIGDSDGAISPDGRTLAFIRHERWARGVIHILPLDADLTPIGQPKPVTFDSRHIGSIAWSADGREIIFASGEAGPQILWRKSISGADEPRRMAVSESARDLLPPNSLNMAIAISRKVRRLAYTQSLADLNIGRASLTDPRVQPEPFIYSTRNDLTPQYSPDGAMIAFESNRTGRTEIWVCKADGSQPVQVTFDYGSRARWSPNGRQLVFQHQKGIFTIGAHGGPVRQVTGAQPADRTPSWSHDGGWIYFASNRTGVSQVWKAPAAGGDAIQVTQKGGSVPFESTDGQWIYYTNLSGDGKTLLWRLPVGGGAETEVIGPGRFALARSGIYFLADKAELRHLAFADGSTRTIRPFKLQLSGGPWFTVSPDERWLLFTQVDQGGSDLLLVENFR